MKFLLDLLLVVSIVHGDPCPWGFTQSADGGDCFNVKIFFDNFIGQYNPKTYNEAEVGCNEDNGALLASIHSKEENAALKSVPCKATAVGGMRNIGLRCKGATCKWDDGTPITYTNFAKGQAPSANDGEVCYGMQDGPQSGTWIKKSCGKQDNDCWGCRVKARTIECAEGESEYKGGCISVHTSPLDQRTAEASCPGGGHLVGIHGGYENDRYKQLAIDAGVNGTIYIGGQYSNGLFEWTDGSNYDVAMWAYGFPNTIFGACVQMLLDSEFGAQGQWTNIECDAKQPYICFRDGAVFPSVAPQPRADPKCPPIQYYTGTGTIYSPNYPLSIPGQQSCEYVIGTTEGTHVGVTFTDYNCQSGYSLSLYDGLNSNVPFLRFNPSVSGPSSNQTFLATGSVMKMVFSANDSFAPVGTGWEAVFDGY